MSDDHFTRSRLKSLALSLAHWRAHPSDRRWNWFKGRKCGLLFCCCHFG
jgi:hypothetical protein